MAVCITREALLLESIAEFLGYSRLFVLGWTVATTVERA